MDAPVVDAPEDGVPVALSLSRWPAYAGLLLAVGLVWFATILLPSGLDKLDRAWRRLLRVARLAAGVSATAWVVGVPLTALYLRGTGPRTLLDAATWRSLPAEEVVITAATVVGVLAAAWLLPRDRAWSSRHQLAALAGLLALAPLPLSGHTRAETETELVVSVDWLHLVAGSVWLGGLVGLGLTLPGLAGRREAAAALVSRFSTAAAAVLAALVLSGAFLAWRIVGSWDALLNDGYGQLLLVKIGVAAFAVAIAAYNRFRLLPRMSTAAGFHDTVDATRALSRTTGVEAVALVGVLLVTGFLTQKSPPIEGLPTAPVSGAQTQRADLGDLEAVVTISPATPGMNTLTLRVRDEDGVPAEGAELPRVRLTSDDLAGDVPLARIEPGTFQGRIVIPREGTWQVQVSLRLSKFDNPVAQSGVPRGRARPAALAARSERRGVGVGELLGPRAAEAAVADGPVEGGDQVARADLEVDPDAERGHRGVRRGQPDLVGVAPAVPGVHVDQDLVTGLLAHLAAERDGHG